MHDRTITPSTGVKPAMAPTETFGDNAGEVLVDANGVTLCAEAFGRPDDPAMLLVQGACASMIRWEVDFCAQRTTSTTWPMTRSGSWTHSASRRRTSSVPRRAG